MAFNTCPTCNEKFEYNAKFITFAGYFFQTKEFYRHATNCYMLNKTTKGIDNDTHRRAVKTNSK